MSTEQALLDETIATFPRCLSSRQFLTVAAGFGTISMLTACSPASPVVPPPAATSAVPPAPATQAAAPAPATQAAAPTQVAPATFAATPTSQAAASTNTAWAPPPVTFVYADSADVSHIDPALITDFWSFSVTRNAYDPLVEIDETKQTLIPWLSTSWETSADGTKTTFHLRDGVLFTDGAKLDADTVKLNLDRTLQLKQGPAYLINNIKDVSVADPMTVVITTQAPDPFVAAHLVKVGIVSGQAIKQHQTTADPWAQEFFKDNIVGS